MAEVEFVIRPLGPWTRPETAPRRSPVVFRASWADTIALLKREVGHLGGRRVVVQVDVTEGDVRRDGMLRGDAKVDFPGVRVSFDSTRGALTYATDAYAAAWSSSMPGWQANVRAIALSLEALRRVDRYGVAASGEQYRGWLALPAGSSEEPLTADAAARLLIEEAGPPYGTTYGVEDMLESPGLVRRAYKIAVQGVHPDETTGDPVKFRRLTYARDLLVEIANAR